MQNMQQTDEDKLADRLYCQLPPSISEALGDLGDVWRGTGFGFVLILFHLVHVLGVSGSMVS